MEFMKIFAQHSYSFVCDRRQCISTHEIKIVGLQNTSQGEMTLFTEITCGTLGYTGKSFNVAKANSRLRFRERQLLQFPAV
jgi:hypothetical protein